MNSSEHDEQVALFNWVRTFENKYPALKMMYANVNAQKFGGATRQHKMRIIARLKAEGLSPGIPDIFLPVCRSFTGVWVPGLYIEMKVKPNKQTETQIEWMNKLEKEGYQYNVCYSWMEAAHVICDYLNLDPEEYGLGGAK